MDLFDVELQHCWRMQHAAWREVREMLAGWHRCADSLEARAKGSSKMRFVRSTRCARRLRRLDVLGLTSEAGARRLQGARLVEYVAVRRRESRPAGAVSTAAPPGHRWWPRRTRWRAAAPLMSSRSADIALVRPPAAGAAGHSGNLFRVLSS